MGQNGTNEKKQGETTIHHATKWASSSSRSGDFVQSTEEWAGRDKIAAPSTHISLFFVRQLSHVDSCELLQVEGLGEEDESRIQDLFLRLGDQSAAFKEEPVDCQIRRLGILDLRSKKVEDGMSVEAAEELRDHSLRTVEVALQLEIGRLKIGNIVLVFVDGALPNEDSHRSKI